MNEAGKRWRKSSCKTRCRSRKKGQCSSPGGGLFGTNQEERMGPGNKREGGGNGMYYVCVMDWGGGNTNALEGCCWCVMTRLATGGGGGGGGGMG